MKSARKFIMRENVRSVNYRNEILCKINMSICYDNNHCDKFLNSRCSQTICTIQKFQYSSGSQPRSCGVSDYTKNMSGVKSNIILLLLSLISSVLKIKMVYTYLLLMDIFFIQVLSVWALNWGEGGGYKDPYLTLLFIQKVWPHFWLVRATCIIHHNQLPMNKFEKNLCHIEPMTWKVQSAADCWTVDRENLETRLCYFLVSGKTKSKMVKLL